MTPLQEQVARIIRERVELELVSHSGLRVTAHLLVNADDLAAEILALPALAPQTGDWVMVPREPTREMWAASAEAINALGHRLKRHHDCYSTASWNAMIAAAPRQAPEADLVGELVAALNAMVEEKADYMQLNHLGDPEEQHTIKLARAVLSRAAPPSKDPS